MTRAAGLGLCLVALVSGGIVLGAQRSGSLPRVTDGVSYAASGQVIRPANYREWMFLTSGLGMTYGPAQPAAGRPPLFDNVFVNPQSYRAFMSTGRWPDGTMFILELRRSVANRRSTTVATRRRRSRRSRRP